MASASATITLVKALKLKNRVVGRIATLDADIKTYNSVSEGKEQLDVPRLFEAREQLVSHLIGLKVALNAANQPVQPLIYELAERKAKVQVLAGLSTQHGKVVEGFSGTLVNYVAQLRKETVDREIRSLEREIDRLQDQLDEFNHQTTITVDARLLGEEIT